MATGGAVMRARSTQAQIKPTKAGVVKKAKQTRGATMGATQNTIALLHVVGWWPGPVRFVQQNPTGGNIRKALPRESNVLDLPFVLRTKTEVERMRYGRHPREACFYRADSFPSEGGQRQTQNTRYYCA